jgi:guanosine-3',5'-bis(diphosphate) 3'-pyrophosphohydrolase
MSNLPKLLQAISFSAKKHRYQRRKGGDAEPYINHPLEVANLLASVGKVTDYEILMAAVLHDTVEDTQTTAEELRELFGENVCRMVLEVTDDKSLPKKRRKELQIEHAPHLSDGAKQVKLCDKISNVTDVLTNPPADWSAETRAGYITWASKVVDGVRGVNKDLEDYFDNLVASAR